MHLDIRPPDDKPQRSLDAGMRVTAFLVLAACASLAVFVVAGAWALLLR